MLQNGKNHGRASLTVKEKKDLLNKKARHSVLQVGDRVLVKNVKERGGPGKLRSHWEKCVYLVTERKGEGPVYVLEPENGGVQRCLHRNLLFPVGSDLQIKADDDQSMPNRKGVNHRKQNKDCNKKVDDRGKSLVDRKKKNSKSDHAENLQEDEDGRNTSSNESSDSSDERNSDIPNKRVSKAVKRFTYDKLGSPTISNLASRNGECQGEMKEIEKILHKLKALFDSIMMYIDGQQS